MFIGAYVCQYMCILYVRTYVLSISNDYTQW